MKSWRRYLDDTIAYVKPEFIANVINSFYYYIIKFAFEAQQNGKIFRCILRCFINEN